MQSGWQPTDSDYFELAPQVRLFENTSDELNICNDPVEPTIYEWAHPIVATGTEVLDPSSTVAHG